MRVSEIIRSVLDAIDAIEKDDQNQQPIEDIGYSENDIKRFKQIAGLTTGKEYSTEPNEQYADINSVTVDAGSDSWQGNKDPADLRGDSFRIYGDN